MLSTISRFRCTVTDLTFAIGSMLTIIAALFWRCSKRASRALLTILVRAIHGEISKLRNQCLPPWENRSLYYVMLLTGPGTIVVMRSTHRESNLSWVGVRRRRGKAVFKRLFSGTRKTAAGSSGHGIRSTRITIGNSTAIRGRQVESRRYWWSRSGWRGAYRALR